MAVGRKTVNLRDFARELGAYTDEQVENVKVATAKAVASSIPHMVETSPVDTGQYASSWGFTQEEEKVIIGNFAPHAGIIEFGARPFKPPIGPLLAWAKRVLQDPSQPPTYSSEVWRLAVGTQKKIEQYGMEPKAVMEKGLDGILEKIRLEYEAIR